MLKAEKHEVNVSNEVPFFRSTTGDKHAEENERRSIGSKRNNDVIWQPSFLIGADLRAGRLVPLLPGYRLPDIDVLAVYPSRRHLSAKVRVMIDFLADAFKETPPWEVNA